VGIVGGERNKTRRRGAETRRDETSEAGEDGGEGGEEKAFKASPQKSSSSGSSSSTGVRTPLLRVHKALPRSHLPNPLPAL
jgi:hypothetical protein